MPVDTLEIKVTWGTQAVVHLVQLIDNDEEIIPSQLAEQSGIIDFTYTVAHASSHDLEFTLVFFEGNKDAELADLELHARVIGGPWRVFSPDDKVTGRWSEDGTV